VRSIGDATHHLKELLEINFTVAIIIDLGDRRVELLGRVHVFELFAGEQLEQLRCVDLPTTVSIKHVEGRFQV